MSTKPPSHPPDFLAHQLPVNKPLVPKKHPITNDYVILSRCLGVGVNGKVLECTHKATGEKRALKVSRCIASGIFKCRATAHGWKDICAWYRVPFSKTREAAN